MNFGEALECLKAGMKVARTGWNGKGMWLAYVADTSWDIFGADALLPHPVRDFIAMKTDDHQLVPWVASQSDMLANDWVVVE